LLTFDPGLLQGINQGTVIDITLDDDAVTDDMHNQAGINNALIRKLSN